MARISQKVYVSAGGVEHRTPQVDTEIVRVKFANGQHVDIELTSLPADIATIACAHGISQKVGDAYAGAEGDVDVAYGLADAMAIRLIGGEWNIKAEGGAAATMLAQALAEAGQVTLAEAIAKIGDMSKEEKADLRKHPQIAAILSRMELEKAQAKAQATAAAAQDAPPLPL